MTCNALLVAWSGRYVSRGFRPVNLSFGFRGPSLTRAYWLWSTWDGRDGSTAVVSMAWWRAGGRLGRTRLRSVLFRRSWRDVLR